MGLPTISVEFKKLATTATARSARGILAVILQDTTKTNFTSKTYTALDEVAQADWTAANYAILSRAFAAGPYQVIAVRVGTDDTMTNAQTILDQLSYNWVCAVPAAFQAGLVAYVKSINTPRRIRKAKALVSGQTSADDIHIVNVANTKVTVKGESTAIDINNYLPRLAGILAACPMDEAVTFQALDDLEAVEAVTGLDASIDGGNLCLFSDDDTIRIARGVNTLKTVTGDLTDDMKKIAVVEAMDLIQEDIIRTFKGSYLGRVKNTADNQALFVTDVSSYLRALADEDVVDSEGISVSIDVSAMRAAWEAAGTSTASLTDAQVKKKTYRSQVFVAAQAHILDAMEDMKMVFTMG